MKKILIGGAALVKLGSDRSTKDVDYLILDKSNKDQFIFDQENNTDYINAANNPFFAAVWDMEKNNIGEIASPQALLELKAYAFVQHCQNFHWNKVNAAEYDIKFLCRNFGLKELKIANKFLSQGEVKEIEKIIKSQQNN